MFQKGIQNNKKSFVTGRIQTLAHPTQKYLQQLQGGALPAELFIVWFLNWQKTNLHR